jgi:hypothetical protein
MELELEYTQLPSIEEIFKKTQVPPPVDEG